MRGVRKFWHNAMDGRCFYCGVHVSMAKEKLPRDWLRVRGSHLMILDHMLPAARGGGDDWENLIPSCFSCNNAKGYLTTDEFRFVRSFRACDFNYRFAREFEAPPRDWLFVCSREFERNMLLANYPDAGPAYSRGRQSPPRKRA